MTPEDTPPESEVETATSQNPSDDDSDSPEHSRHGDNGEGDRRNVVSYLEWGAVVSLGLVALVAVFRFYFAASRAISVWISPDFEPLFQAAFNLVVLLLAATGIVVFARRRWG